MSDNGAMSALSHTVMHAPTALALRPMLASDLDAVVLLEQQVYPHPWTRGNFADALAAGYHAQCLHHGGELCGYVVAMAGVEEAHLLNITVARHLQGQGHGHHLWQHLCACAAMLPHATSTPTGALKRWASAKTTTRPGADNAKMRWSWG